MPGVRRANVPSMHKLVPSPPPPPSSPPPGEGTVTWPMNIRKSIGNHKKIFSWVTLELAAWEWCSVPPPPQGGDWTGGGGYNCLCHAGPLSHQASLVLSRDLTPAQSRFAMPQEISIFRREGAEEEEVPVQEPEEEDIEQPAVSTRGYAPPSYGAVDEEEVEEVVKPKWTPPSFGRSQADDEAEDAEEGVCCCPFAGPGGHDGRLGQTGRGGADWHAAEGGGGPCSGPLRACAGFIFQQGRGGGGGRGHTNDGAPRPQREHRPQRPTERSDPTQHAKGRAGDCPGPRKGATTRRNVTRGAHRRPLSNAACGAVRCAPGRALCCALPLRG